MLAAPLLAAAACMFLTGTTAAQGPPTATPTVVPPIYEQIGPGLVDQFRIESVWTCGGSVNRCMHAESDPLILARVAMGEAPHSLSDRVYIMWSIRLRAALGFKESLPGYRAVPNRWGPETSIAVEALCNGGCQYSPVRAAEGIYFPCQELAETHALRSMLCPTDEQLEDFYLTWTFAEAIAFARFDEFPLELRGYESFRSPDVTWHGQVNRPGGLRSAQFFRRGNIWRDEFPQDNVFWKEFDWKGFWESLSPTPSATSTPPAIATISPPSPTAPPTLTPRPTSATVEPGPPRATQEDRMLAVVLVAPLLLLLQALTDEQTATVALLTLGIVQFLKVVYIGVLKRPKPSKGSMRLFVFVISVPIGYAFAGLVLPPVGEDPMAFAQALIGTAGAVLIQSGLVYDYMLDGVFGFLDYRVLGRKGKTPLLAP
ncbi:MAG: hypothetical protein ACRD1K_20635 [Acidimicrobiales bacterium]